MNEREAFEKWISDDGKWPQGLKRAADGSYTHMDTHHSWFVWQAARAHLAQPAQAVDVGAIREVADSLAALACLNVPSMAGYARKLTRAISGEKAGPVDGIAIAAAYIQKKADDYAAENCGTEWDTGATTYRYGQAGQDYHYTLLELAEEIAALPASPAPDKEG